MNTDAVHLILREWQHLDPASSDILRGFWFKETDERELARHITEAGMVEVLELRDGLSIRSKSYVGKIRIGRLTLTIKPKISGFPLMVLLRYAYHLRKLHSLPLAEYSVAAMGLQDLLIIQLVAEARELISKGLFRQYIRTQNRLERPRGRLDMNRIAMQSVATEPRLACVYHPRQFDCLPNQVLLSGLHLAARLTEDKILRSECRRLASLIEEEVTLVTLNRSLFRKLESDLDRLMAAYRTPTMIIGLLHGGQGIVLDETDTALTIPGFLLDMNHFFQSLISRFLRENLSGFRVRDEQGLKHMMCYLRDYNPMHRRSPTPRPDFIVQERNQVVAVLDAKYRDLWELPLPREMLYQLAIYALGQKDLRQATILYPTLSRTAKESRVAIKEPASGRVLGQVVIRPVDLVMLENLISKPNSTVANRAREAFAQKLAFGRGKSPN